MRLLSSCFGKSHLLLSSVYLSKWTLESLWNFHEIPLGLGKSINSVWKNGILQCRFLSPLLRCFVWSGFKEVSWESWLLPYFFPAFVCESYSAVYWFIIAIVSFCVHLKCFFITFYSFKGLLLFMCMCFCISACHVCASACVGQKRAFYALDLDFIEGSELPDGGAGDWTRVLCRNSMHS